MIKKSSELFLVVGLGNPGSRYRETRHNLGFRVVEQWCREKGEGFRKTPFSALAARFRLMDKDIIALLPSTYMNLSGKAVRLCADYYKIKAEHIIVVHDDLDLPLGKVKVKKNGGAGGHKGVLSVIKNLSTKDFIRIKVGIGRPATGEEVERYVLSSFNKDEKKIVEESIGLAVMACEISVLNGVEKAMNKINCQIIS